MFQLMAGVKFVTVPYRGSAPALQGLVGAETLPGFSSAAWFAVVAPPKTPQRIVDKIGADIAEALKQPEIVQRLAALSAEVVGTSPQESVKYFRDEVARWHKVIKDANIKME